jgi:hypothetical protein
MFTASNLLAVFAVFPLPLVNASWEDNFPSCTLPALYQYMPSDCLDASGTFVADQAGNACLCPLKIYIEDVAQLVWGNCGCDILIQMAGTYVSICNSTSTPAPYTQAQIVAIGSGSKVGCVVKPIVSAGAVSSDTVQPTSTAKHTAPASGSTTSSATQSPTVSGTAQLQGVSRWTNNQIIGTTFGIAGFVITFIGITLEIIGRRKERPHLRPTYQANWAYHRISDLARTRNHMPVPIPLENLRPPPDNVAQRHD